ncbi:hypothetical protein BD310DRAFT_977164, partial [Dichomitus squalens]
VSVLDTLSHTGASARVSVQDGQSRTGTRLSVSVLDTLSRTGASARVSVQDGQSRTGTSLHLVPQNSAHISVLCPLTVRVGHMQY